MGVAVIGDAQPLLRALGQSKKQKDTRAAKPAIVCNRLGSRQEEDMLPTHPQTVFSFTSTVTRSMKHSNNFS